MQTLFKGSNDIIQDLADALGANYESGVLYKGDNGETGFELSLSENTLTVNLAGSDSVSQNTLTLDISTGINYEKSGSCAVFGAHKVNNSDEISPVQCAIVPYNSASGGGYLYILKVD